MSFLQSNRPATISPEGREEEEQQTAINQKEEMCGELSLSAAAATPFNRSEKLKAKDAIVATANAEGEPPHEDGECLTANFQRQKSDDNEDHENNDNATFAQCDETDADNCISKRVHEEAKESAVANEEEVNVGGEEKTA